MPQFTGEDIGKAASGIKTLLSAIKQYLREFVILCLIIVIWFLIKWSGNKYNDGYTAGKNVHDVYTNSLEQTIKYQDRQIQVIQAQYDTLYIRWREDKQIAYQQLIIKKEQ